MKSEPDDKEHAPRRGSKALRKAVKRTGCPVVLIQWVDSAGPDGWVLKEEWGRKLVPCSTVCWLLKETEDAYIISSTVGNAGGDSEQSYAPLAIPKASVLKLKRLCE